MTEKLSTMKNPQRLHEWRELQASAIIQQHIEKNNLLVGQDVFCKMQEAVVETLRYFDIRP